jgi:hypothetical protein
MQLQKQDYVAAERIQRELMIRLPGDPVITEFSKFLPAEALAQKNAANEYGDEYYDEEDEGGKDKAAEKEEEEEEEPEEDEETQEPTTTTLTASEQPATENPSDSHPTSTHEGDKKKKEGDSEYEDEDDDGYGEEDYDEEGRYKWGQEGNDWDWYYREDKEAYERGDPMPNTLNPPVMLDKETIERAVEAKQRMESASTQASSTKEN